MEPDGTDGTPLPVDTLIAGATLVTMDGTRRIVTDGALAIAGERIAAVGKRTDVVRRVRARETIDGRRFVITPGFVNGHVHTTETLIKGIIPENVGLEEGIWRWSVPLYQCQTAAEQALAAKLSAAAMLRTGTTCFLEAGTIIALEAVFEGLAETGIRGRVGEWVLDRADSDQAAHTGRALKTLEAELMRYPPRRDARLAAWPLLIGHNTATDALWQGATQLALAHGAGMSAHMSPTDGDPQWYLAHTGCRPIVHLAELGVLGEHLTLAHGVHLDIEEVSLLAAGGCHVAFCPGAALKGGFGAGALGLFPEMAASGVNVMLGTDGADHADLMRAMTLMAGLFKDARRDTALFPAGDALTMATRNGAAALGLAREIGSLETGKKADFVLHDTERPEWVPLSNVLNQLVWSADGRGVHSVWVDGRRVVDNYRCTTIDEEKLHADADTAAQTIFARSGLPKVSPWPCV